MGEYCAALIGDRYYRPVVRGVLAESAGGLPLRLGIWGGMYGGEQGVIAARVAVVYLAAGAQNRGEVKIRGEPSLAEIDIEAPALESGDVFTVG